MQESLNDRLHVVVGWLPGVPDRSLAQGAKALAPAVLYGDSVTVICPQSDDALEMQDYFDLREAVPGAVEFDALDSRYPAFDDAGEPLVNEAGQYMQQPYAPAVWSGLLELHLKTARDDWVTTAQQKALDAVSRAAVLLEWSFHSEDETVVALHG